MADGEVEEVAKFLRAQGEPQYLEEVTAAPDEDDDGDGARRLRRRRLAATTSTTRPWPWSPATARPRTSYVQRRLQIGYNRAASLIERMEKEGVVGAANHAGKREVLVRPPPPL